MRALPAGDHKKKDVIPLDLSWPAEFVDNNACLIKERAKPDSDFSDYNMTILAAQGKVNDIFKTYRLQDRILTVELFRKEFNPPLPQVPPACGTLASHLQFANQLLF